MKAMKLLPFVAVLLILLGVFGNDILSKIQFEKPVATTTDSEEEEDTTAYSWVEPHVPSFLANYMDSAVWIIDTLCSTSDETYFFGSEDHGRMNVIFTSDKILCEDPTLNYFSVDTFPDTKTYHILTASKSIIVDFTDKNSILKLNSLMTSFTSVERFTKDYFSEIGNMVLYHIDIDYPKGNDAYSDNLRKWLVHLTNESYYIDDSSPYPSALAVGSSSKSKSNKHRYTGNLHDVAALGKYAAKKYFFYKKDEYKGDKENYPSVLSLALSLRLVSTNGKYWSYQMHTHDYDGGMHGYYTESIESFDPVTNKEIDWAYLFLPGNKDKILSLFFKVVQQDPNYKIWEETGSIAGIKKHFEMEYKVDNVEKDNLSKPGLTDDGVTFSYQPYQISCFGAGCFHFTIPYNDLKPFMTQRAKKLLNL